MSVEEKKKPRKLSKKAADKNWIDTMECYCLALKDTFPEQLKDFDRSGFRAHGVDRILRSHLIDQGADLRAPEIHRRYMYYIKLLSTKQLETIIVANVQGFVRRSPATIDEIQTEIFDRTVKEMADGN